MVDMFTLLSCADRRQQGRVYALMHGKRVRAQSRSLKSLQKSAHRFFEIGGGYLNCFFGSALRDRLYQFFAFFFPESIWNPRVFESRLKYFQSVNPFRNTISQP